MKHIKRKCQSENQVSTAELEESFIALNLSENKDGLKQLKLEKGQKCLLQTNAGLLVEAFPLKLNGKVYYIPEPDPVLLYFDIAQRQSRSISESIKSVLKAYDIEQGQIMFDTHKIYSHFELSAVFIISLFTSMEAFINKMIPDDYKYEDIKANRTEIYNKEQIQKYLSFDVKVKKILKDISGKDFAKQYPLKFDPIQKLKEFRDAIIHTKTSSEGHTPYHHLFRSSFLFKYEDTIYCVRDFINYYSPGLVEECDCGKDF